MWEYKEVTVVEGRLTEEQLNANGDAGWELIAVVAFDRYRLQYLFKRPRSERSVFFE